MISTFLSERLLSVFWIPFISFLTQSQLKLVQCEVTFGVSSEIWVFQLVWEQHQEQAWGGGGVYDWQLKKEEASFFGCQAEHLNLKRLPCWLLALTHGLGAFCRNQRPYWLKIACISCSSILKSKNPAWFTLGSPAPKSRPRGKAGALKWHLFRLRAFLLAFLWESTLHLNSFL